eukprot:30139-Pelagococcus_subviridis.AAC.1
MELRRAAPRQPQALVDAVRDDVIATREAFLRGGGGGRRLLPRRRPRVERRLRGGGARVRRGFSRGGAPRGAHRAADFALGFEDERAESRDDGGGPLVVAVRVRGGGGGFGGVGGVAGRRRDGRARRVFFPSLLRLCLSVATAGRPLGLIVDDDALLRGSV